MCPAGTIRYPSKWGWVASQVEAPLIVYNLFPSGSEEDPSSMHCLHNLSSGRISFISASYALNKQYFQVKTFSKAPVVEAVKSINQTSITAALLPLFRIRAVLLIYITHATRVNKDPLQFDNLTKLAGSRATFLNSL